MRTATLAGTCLLALLAAAGTARAACTNADLKGAYGLSGTGTIVQPPNTPVTGPFARAGLASFDGAGAVTFATNASYNGFIFAEPFKGTYTVAADCSFTINVTVPDPINLPATFGGLISAGGDQADFFLLDPQGTTIAASLIRQPRTKCQNLDLAGSYTLRASGQILAPNPLAGPFTRLGTFTGKAEDSIFAIARKTPGTFTIAANTSYGGLVKAETFSGTYQVNPDCTAHFEYSQPSAAGAVTSSFDGMLVDENKQVVFVMTTVTNVIAGTMTRQ